MRISLPSLETVGWYDGCKAEGEPVAENISGEPFGGNSLLSFMKEWTTARQSFYITLTISCLLPRLPLTSFARNFVFLFYSMRAN